MITSNANFFIINPESGIQSPAARGKWLFFGEGDTVAGLVSEIDALVKSGELLGALVSRKTPGEDPYPHKDPILCVYTTDKKNDIERVRQVMIAKLGLEPVLWKSDEQTFADFKSGGWLKLESQIIDLKREFADRATITTDWHLLQLKKLTKKLRTLFETAEGDRKIEMELNHIDTFLADTESLISEFIRQQLKK